MIVGNECGVLCCSFRWHWMNNIASLPKCARRPRFGVTRPSHSFGDPLTCTSQSAPGNTEMEVGRSVWSDLCNISQILLLALPWPAETWPISQPPRILTNVFGNWRNLFAHNCLAGPRNVVFCWAAHCVLLFLGIVKSIHLYVEIDEQRTTVLQWWWWWW